jgi:hypothetical protein
VDDATGWEPVIEAGFDHERFALYVWRSVRADGDTKTEKSRRTLEVPDDAAMALKALHKRQAAQRLVAGEAWHDHMLVFSTRTRTGTALAAGNVRRSFRAITRAAKVARRLGTPGDTAHVRVDHERQRRAHRDHR